MKNVLNHEIGKNKQSNHPTEKPEFLIGWLVEVFINPNDIVLDSFAGGGRRMKITKQYITGLSILLIKLTNGNIL